MSSHLSCPPGTVLHMQKGALSIAEACEALGLSQMRGWRWHVSGGAESTTHPLNYQP